jgi:hypothetical protein
MRIRLGQSPDIFLGEPSRRQDGWRASALQAVRIARRLLHGHRLSALRQLLGRVVRPTDLRRYDSHDVVERALLEIRRGRLVIERTERRVTWFPDVEEPEEALGPATVPPEEIDRPREIEEPPTFTPTVDVSVQILSLQRTAARGRAFCEVCEARRAARRARVEPAGFARVSVAAQVAALKEAARAGAPVCERCEPRRQARRPVASGGSVTPVPTAVTPTTSRHA